MAPLDNQVDIKKTANINVIDCGILCDQAQDQHTMDGARERVRVAETPKYLAFATPPAHTKVVHDLR